MLYVNKLLYNICSHFFVNTRYKRHTLPQIHLDTHLDTNTAAFRSNSPN